MVCEKKPGCSIDFEKDGSEIGIDGDNVYAEGTTLGGDDGIAVAYALALLDDESIPHPRLEVIFTTSEKWEWKMHLHWIRPCSKDIP